VSIRVGTPPIEEAPTITYGQDPAVSARNAAVAVGGRTVWSHLDVEIGRGEFAAILGPNGAGKSTLLKAMLGLVPLAAGHLEVLGQAPGEARSQIGYLPQRRSFDSGLRIRGVDLVRLGLDGDRLGVPLPGFWPSRNRERRTEVVAEMIDLVGASPYATRPIGELSGGEQQRLLVAQALVRRPRLLMLDEPLDSLDLPNQAAVAALIADISRQTNITVLMVAHDVNPILPYLDRVVYLAGGTGLAGRPSEVITSDTLSRLYGTPIEVLRSANGPVVVVGQPDAPAIHTDRHTGRPHP
jgi:zinc/manganese transport system ATP-binding protein